MITKYIVGDITETELKYIAHGVNCQNKMGSGVAKSLFEKFPDIKTHYHTTNAQHKPILGDIQEVRTQKKVIYNLLTQKDFGNSYKNHIRYVNYSAIVEVFNNLKKYNINEPIAIPKIGCGLAGGDWKFVEQLINDTVGDDLEIWVYELEVPAASSRNNLA